MQSGESKQLTTPVQGIASKEKITGNNFYQISNQRGIAAGKVAGKKLPKTSSWIPILLFASVVMIWVLYILINSEKHTVSSYPFFLMTFFLIGVALFQIPVYIVRQYRKDRASSGYIDVNKNDQK